MNSPTVVLVEVAGFVVAAAFVVRIARRDARVAANIDRADAMVLAGKFAWTRSADAMAFAGPREPETAATPEAAAEPDASRPRFYIATRTRDPLTRLAALIRDWLRDRIRHPAPAQGWDGQAMTQIVADLHRPGAMPKPAGEHIAPETITPVEAITPDDGLWLGEERHPNELFRSGMTGFTREHAAALDALIAANADRANADLDAAFAAYHEHAVAHLLNRAGAQ